MLRHYEQNWPIGTRVLSIELLESLLRSKQNLLALMDVLLVCLGGIFIMSIFIQAEKVQECESKNQTVLEHDETFKLEIVKLSIFFC